MRRHPCRNALCLCLALLALAPLRPAAAQAGAEPEAAPSASLPGPSLHGVLRLSLADAIRMGLENNLDVEVERYAPTIAAQDARVAWGAYDPGLFGEYTYSSIQNPNSLTLNLGVSESEDYTSEGFGGFRGLVPFLGSSYELRFDSERVDTNSSIQSPDPALRSSFLLGLTQPVLKNLFFNPEWTLVQTSQIGKESAFDNFRRQVMDTIREIANFYWILIANEEKRRVAEKSVETARALLDQVTTQFEVGVVSKVEVVEAEAGLAARELDLIRAQNAYRRSQDDLIDVVLGRHFAANSTLEIAPTDRPEDYVRYEIDVEESVRKAFRHRPELSVAEKRIQQGELELGLARNQRLPQLDLVVSYGNRGLAGRENKAASCRFLSGPALLACLATPISDTPYGDTLDGFFTDDASEQFTAGARFSLPIPNTAPRATASKRELELRRARTEKIRLEQDIILQVRDSVRNLESAQEGIRAAERRQAAAAEQLRAERIRLEYGEATPFDVLQREEDLVEAESEKIDALRIYRVSATDLDRAQGTILDTNHVLVEEVGALR
jgi:outer membrane protein TolC